MTSFQADLAGEVLTEYAVGVMMLAVNVPMACYLVYDLWSDTTEHLSDIITLTQTVVNPMGVEASTE